MSQRWQRISSSEIAIDPELSLRVALNDVKAAPRDQDARRRLRGLAGDAAVAEKLAAMLAEDARATEDADVAAALYEELADVYENLDQSVEAIAAMEAVVDLFPEDPDHHDRLAWLYRRAGAWAKAAAAFERVGELARDARWHAALRAAAQLYREHRQLDRAAVIVMAIVRRRPGDSEAWKTLDDLLAELGRWRDLADIRGKRAARAESGVEKAALLRAQARALEQAGDARGAAAVVASASRHAPEDVSGQVDYAEVLARGGQGREAATILEARVAHAIATRAKPEDVAALRLRLVAILDDSLGDREAAKRVLDELLAASPEYLPALERLAAQTAVGGDPRAHAAVLLRYAAALPDDVDRSGAVIEAARRYRDAHDFAAAVRTYETACDIVPDDANVRRELDEARTALVVERAAEEAAAGDRVGAERRLRAILVSQPHDVGANLALADLLGPAAAAEHLSTVLAEMPEDTPNERLARLVHRFALATAAFGDSDEAHQLLHEAHRLDRRSLVITLALGESCFQRKVWRQAALHLGSLAEHPDAPRHAAAVAAALVHAAQAETRTLRPANAAKHYESALRLDPACAPAWHALAEIANERGDTVRAADCLEKEAAATTNPADRLRLWDALGDMANDVLGDAVRAERCWAALGDAATEPILVKLLAVQRKRGATIERAETCERIARLADAPRKTKQLLEEAAEAYAAGGDLGRALPLAEKLIDAHPHDLDAAASAAAVAAALGDSKRVAAWLRRALVSGPRASAARIADGADEQDPRRADLWRQLGDAERAVGNFDAAEFAYRRATALAPDSDGALAARRGLVGLADEDSNITSESSLFALVEFEQDPDDVLAWARTLSRGTDTDTARAGFELAWALGCRFAAGDTEFLARHPARRLASDEAYPATVDDADRRAVITDDDDAPLGDILEILGEAASLVCPDARTALVDADLGDARPLSATSNAAAAAVYPKIARAFGGPTTLLYSSPRATSDTQLLLAAPPVVVLGPQLVAIRAGSRGDDPSTSDAPLRFQLGRMVELARPRRVFAAALPRDAFADLVAGLALAFGRASSAPHTERRGARDEADRLRSKLPLALRQRLTDKLASAGALDPDAYIAACHRAADRVGLLACHDVIVAIQLAGGPDEARHLVKLAAAQRYLTLRAKLRGAR